MTNTEPKKCCDSCLLAPTKLQESFKQERYKEILESLRELQESFKRASRKLQERFKKASREIQEKFKKDSRELRQSFNRL